MARGRGGDEHTGLDDGRLGRNLRVQGGFDLLFAAGRSVAGQAETYTYLALYWTWGPKGRRRRCGQRQSGLMAMLTKMRLR